MRLKDLKRWRELVLVDYLAGRYDKEAAQAKCRVITRAIESMAKMQDEQMKEQIKAAK
jgi:hypothetical protein